jgi:putative flippase GtrA
VNQLFNYLLVGGLVTLVDLIVYQQLTGASRLPRVAANVLSTSIGMALGFTLHFALVFHPRDPQLAVRVGRYLVTVGCSVYGVQNLVIYALGEVWRGPVRCAQGFVKLIEGKSRDRDDFIDRMTGKVVATAAGMVWNFVLFKYVVYA